MITQTTAGRRPSTSLRVGELWRYPVKSLRGERLTSTAVGADGFPGDRVVHVRGPRGLLTGRTRHGLLTLPATTAPDGRPFVAGHPWDSSAAAGLVHAAAGPGAELVADASRDRFDVLPLLVVTDAEVARLGADRRRLRPNLVITGAAAGDERRWPGQALRVGTALLGVHALRPRCIVTTIDPDTGAQDLDVLRRIRREFDGALALDCWVIEPGVVSVGDVVQVLPLPAAARHMASPGGWVTGRPYPVDAGSGSRAPSRPPWLGA